MKIDLNCDLGEGMETDEVVMPLITSANIACGFHAGDAGVMRATVKLAKKYGVNIGAHPGWDDRENFGRHEMDVSGNEVEALVLVQIKVLAEIAKIEGTALTHVKPHGALYNQAAKDVELANAIARAVKSFSVDLILVGLAGSRLCEAGVELGLRVAAEGFPDRAYLPDGNLMPRSEKGSVIEDPREVAGNAVRLVKLGQVDTLCLHGDNFHAVENAKFVRKILLEQKIEVRCLT